MECAQRCRRKRQQQNSQAETAHEVASAEARFGFQSAHGNQQQYGQAERREQVDPQRVVNQAQAGQQVEAAFGAGRRWQGIGVGKMNGQRQGIAAKVLQGVQRQSLWRVGGLVIVEKAIDKGEVHAG